MTNSPSKPHTVEHTLRILETALPQCFPPNPYKVRPLAPDIVDAIAASVGDRDLTHRNIQDAFAYHIERRCYKRSLLNEQSLFDITGQPVTAIPESDRLAADAWLRTYDFDICLSALQDERIPPSERALIARILETDCRDLKLQSAALATTRRQKETLALRTAWVRATVALHQYHQSASSEHNLRYASYYRAVSELNVHLLDADFVAARECVQSLRESATYFQCSDQFFPNVFYNLHDIDNCIIWIDAIESYRDGDFAAAQEAFQNWLKNSSELAHIHNSHYDSINACSSLCEALKKSREGKALHWKGWYRVEHSLTDPDRNIWRTTWLLWDIVKPLKSLTEHSSQLTKAEQDVVDNTIRKAQQSWTLLLRSAPIFDRSRHQGKPTEILPPSFLDIAGQLATCPSSHVTIVQLALRNALMLKADFEERRKRAPQPEEPSLRSYQICELSDEELIELIDKAFARKSRAQSDLFRKSIYHWRKAHIASQKHKVNQ